MRAMMFVVGALAGTLITQGCGGGLSHVVSEDALKALSAEQRVKVDLAREGVTEAQRKLQEMAKQVEVSKSAVSKADDRVDKAEKGVKSAQAQIDKADADLKAKVKAAAQTRDAAVSAADTRFTAAKSAAQAEHTASPNEARMKQSIESADSIRDADVSVAKANFERSEAVAKAEHAKVQDTNRGVLADKKTALGIEQARLDFEEALLEERKARHEALEAELWVARARYELAKYDAVGEAQGNTDSPDYTKKRLAFQEQLADREADQRQAAQEVVEAEARTAKAKQILDQRSPPPAPTATPAPAG